MQFSISCPPNLRKKPVRSMESIWQRIRNTAVYKQKYNFMRLCVVVAHGRILFWLLWDKLSRSGQRRHRLPISAALRSDCHSPPNHLNGGITNDDHQSERLLSVVHPRRIHRGFRGSCRRAPGKQAV